MLEEEPRGIREEAIVEVTSSKRSGPIVEAITSSRQLGLKVRRRRGRYNSKHANDKVDVEDLVDPLLVGLTSVMLSCC